MEKIKAKGSTRDFVPIKEVKDGIVILEDGTLVGIILATSINISLKSYEEQQAVIASFQAFLNTIDFPIQISVQSRKLDIKPYIELLEKRLKEQENELIKLQTIEYINFIKNFSENIDIMDKQFFVVVSYQPALVSAKKGFFASIFKVKKNDGDDKLTFEEGKVQLEQRISVVESTLGRTGVKTKLLDTEAVLEVFYSVYNPGSETNLI